MVARTTPAGAQVLGTPIPISFGNGVPGGWLGYLPRTSDQTGITAEVDVSGVTVTVVVNTSRRLLVTGYTSGFTMSNVDTVAQLSIYEGSTQLGYARVPCAFASLSYNPPCVVQTVLTPGAGSHTYKLRASRVVGTGSVTIAADSERPCFILVTDLGPA